MDALEKYRGKCKPCFLFFAGGVLVAVIRGANSPLITKTITEQFNQEHKVLDGNSERKEVRSNKIFVIPIFISPVDINLFNNKRSTFRHRINAEW